MSQAESKTGVILLVFIAMLLAAGIVFIIFYFRSDPIEESLSGDQVINTLFVIEDGGKPLCAYVLMYYPPTRRAAIFDIPGSLGLIIPRINRYDRIDLLYDSQRIASYEDEVKNLLGIDISYYVVFTLENLGKVTDILEGVEVFVPIAVNAYRPVDEDYSQGGFLDDFADIESVLFPYGMVTLDGDKVKSYITYELPEENSDMGVFRKQRFFLGLLKRLGEQNIVLKNSQIAGLFQSSMKTNMSSHIRTRLFDAYAGIDIDRVNIQSVSGTEREVSGQVLIFPHWEGNLIKDIVRQSITSMRSADDSFSERVFTVEVQNGTEVTGLAGRTAELLRGFGYDVISIGNADRNNYQQTVIIDRSGYEDRARAFGEIIRCQNIIFDTLPEDLEFDVELGNYEYRADFTLILGRDFNERYVTGN